MRYRLRQKLHTFFNGSTPRIGERGGRGEGRGGGEGGGGGERQGERGEEREGRNT